MVEDSSSQRIARLTPLHEVLAVIDSRVGMVSPQRRQLAAALGRVLAEDIAVSQLPPSSIALRDGYAVEAVAIVDAGPYAPLPFPSLPPRVDVGEPLPCGTDAVAPFDAVALRGGRAEAVAAVSPGEGMLPAGGDASPRAPLRCAGERLRAIDIAVLGAAGVAEVTVREPRIRIACGSAATTPLIDAAIGVLVGAISLAGGTALDPHREPARLDKALADEQADAVVAVGGTGCGRLDTSVRTLARRGRVAAHGIAVAPGETAAFGFAGERPVLLVPGRLDAALAVWLLLGRRLLGTLSGSGVKDVPAMLALKRKVTSTIGLAELIPVRRDGGMVEPLASGYLSFESLARSDGWIVIPADSEGLQAGTQVAVRSWP